MDKGKLLDRCGARGEDRLLLARVLDKLEQAQSRNIPTHTDFLTPQQQQQTLDLLRFAAVPETAYVRMGGYDGAERNLFLFLPDWLEPEEAGSQSPIRSLRAEVRGEEQPTHRDFLGSLMGMGIVREKLGDLLVSPEGCDLMVLETVADFLLQNWDSAGRAKLTVRAIEPWDVKVPEARYREVRDTVSSLRLDAVIASGFGMARGKAADLISGGKVQVNWRECTKVDKLLVAGDVLSVRGLGKAELNEVGGVTKKGRTVVTLKRYL